MRMGAIFSLYAISENRSPKIITSLKLLVTNNYDKLLGLIFDH